LRHGVGSASAFPEISLLLPSRKGAGFLSGSCRLT
jgi:hypothetical protein